ncbi:MAG: hypothetical protein DHS20C05_10520 [Hyphococcus sp.]|nr:MAG: hypothetical protein DHS20C05_10520 [Marinicaulis sp.]
MRILGAILLFLTGAASVAYSYIGAFVTLAGEVETSLYGDAPLTAVSKIFQFISAGEIPQLTAFLYIGAFIIAVSVVILIMGKSPRND